MWNKPPGPRHSEKISPKYMIELISDGMPIGYFKLLLWDGTQSFIQD